MQTHDDWQTCSPDQVGLDGSRLTALDNWLNAVPGSNVHSVLVVRHGALVFEHYRIGADERWRKSLPDVDHGTDVKHDLRSVTKAITGLLVGKAIDKELLPSLDVPVFDFFPDYADLRTQEKDRILLRHLLTMSAGLDWDENKPADDPLHGELRLWRSTDRIRTALEPALVSTPGSAWNYSGGSTELLGAILQRATGKPLDVFAQDNLFEPLSIFDVEWARHLDGAPSASGGLRLRSRDLAKIGQLMAAAGQWKDLQILSATWINESTKPHIGCSDRLYFYGYHWWLGRSLAKGTDISWVAGIGLGGQRLFVLPGLDMVVVITAGHYSDAMQTWLPLKILNQQILAAIQ